MHVSTQDLILVGVALHLLAALGKTLFKSPKRQAQIDAIEAKVDGVLDQLQAGATAPALTLVKGGADQ